MCVRACKHAAEYAVRFMRGVPPELPTDVITYLLCHNIGPHTFANARQVNRAWAKACEDERLIECVAAYANGLTRTRFRGILRLTSKQACSYPFRSHRVVTSDGIKECFLYSHTTVRRAMHELGGLDGIRSRSPALAVVRREPATLDGFPRRSRAQMDEKLHADKMMKNEAMFMKKLCPSMPYAERQARSASRANAPSRDPLGGSILRVKKRCVTL